MGLMEKLKELIGEFDGDEDDGVDELGNAAGEEAEEVGADDAQGSEEEAAGEDDDEAEESAPAKRAAAPKHAKKTVRVRKRKPESEAGDAEESEQEEMHDNEKDGLAELQAKVAKLEAEVAKGKGGKTGLEPAGAATTSDADVKRWREIAGLED